MKISLILSTGGYLFGHLFCFPSSVFELTKTPIIVFLAVESLGKQDKISATSFGDIKPVIPMYGIFVLTSFPFQKLK